MQLPVVWICRCLSPLLLPLMVAMGAGRWRLVIDQDVARWGELASRWGTPVRPEHGRTAFRAWLLLRPEFRSLVFLRMRHGGAAGLILSLALSTVYRGQRSLHLHCADVGPGLYLEHAFSTIVVAERIGRNCWINQQVTIGTGSTNDCPTIGDDVMIRAGAIVVGGVHLGDGCRVLAGAVVTRDVDPGTTVAGSPARPIRVNDSR